MPWKHENDKGMGDLTATWIAGLMRENYEAVGFIPTTTVDQQYIRLRRFIAQSDERGRPVGYLLHGAIACGRVVSIAQHCIQYESRLRGHGEHALHELVARAAHGSASGITARVATDLDALAFWIAQGFEIRAVVAGGLSRTRTIACLWLPLAMPFDAIW